MSARDENLRQACGLGSGKDTHGPAVVGGVHPGPAQTVRLADEALEQIRKGGLILPRGPYPGQPWTPRTPAETHLLREGQRLERVRQALLAEVGRLRHHSAVRAARRQRLEKTARTAERPADCPLTQAQLDTLAAFAVGETLEDTSRRLLVPYDTIRSRRRRTVARLGARSVTHAVALAVAAGWITPEQITQGVTP